LTTTYDWYLENLKYAIKTGETAIGET
jgi:hypothetical protein